MPKNLKYKTTFDADGNMGKKVTGFSKALTRMSRAADMAKRSLKAAGRAAMFVGRATANMAKFGFGLATVAAAGLVAATFKVADSMDSLAKQTRSINFPIEEFQEWRFAAEQSGIAGDSFGKGMETFNKRLGKLKGGFGPLNSALRKTDKGLLKNLKGAKNTGEAMDIMTRAIRDAKGADMKSMLADAAFGLTKMNLLAGNSEEQIKELRSQMRENGVVTAEQAAKAEEFNDMWNRMKLTIMGVARDAIAPLLPQMTKLSGAVRKWVSENKKLIGLKIKDMFKAAWKNVKLLYEWTKKSMPAIKEFFATLWRGAEVLWTVAKSIWEFKEQLLGLYLAFKTAQIGSKLLLFGKGVLEVSSAVGGGSKGAVGALGKLSGALGKAGLVGAAAAAGVAIGSLITELLNKSQDKTLDEANKSATESKNISSMSGSQLDEFIKKQSRSISKTKGAWAGFTDVASGRFENEGLRSNAREAKFTAMSEKLARMQDIDARFQALRNARNAGQTIYDKAGNLLPDSEIPALQTSGTTNTEVKEIKLTIDNKSGQSVEVDGDMIEGFDMLQSGAI